ncbi:C6 zinc finger domain-containing protein [Sporormia fimetaria CBS 119925]|uniref:C6 zinc finger domain-containing protein n=1 Tax=Sporormia fimetaria CBS 119925 TaxID=1340428 RepID=A0A6A6VDN6_9PLEO|nr:C6 zinc finger domain-containing protein [Sporormia fimetaria CBS 119925]
MTTPRRKACVECRQQKIRCDVEQHKVPHEPCSRCKKMGIDCRILPTSTRNLRQTKAEMRRELEELKWGLRRSQEANHLLPAPLPPPLPGPPGPGGFPPIEPQQTSPMAPSVDFSSGRTDASMSLSPNFQPPAGDSRPGTRSGSTVSLPRGLGGYVVDGPKIDHLFTTYFTQYHALLPILDNTKTPNDYYEESKFLFWSIIVTGARRYTEDPRITRDVSQLITPLAFESMALRQTPIPVIQGLLILCTWRLPTSSMFLDITHVLCGAAVHLATQIGLHVAGVGQDFARQPLKKDQDQMVFRAKLWMYCIVVYIRSGVGEGIPPLVLAEPHLDGDEREREQLMAHLPAHLKFSHQVHIILLRAMSAFARMDLRTQDCNVDLLKTLVGIYDTQLHSLASQSPGDYETFAMNCARVHVMAFHFYAEPAQADLEALARLYGHCLQLCQDATNLCQNTNLIGACPAFIDRTMNLTGFIILKLVRSPLIAQHLDLAAGERAYFQAINFGKTMSIHEKDLNDRAAEIMRALWGSQKVFRKKDGHVESLGLRLRTRLSMSIPFDMFWYWREEFQNTLNPYSDDKSSGHGDDNVSMPSNQPETPQFDSKGDMAAAGGAPIGMKFPPGMPQPGLPFDPNIEGYDPTVNPMLDQFLDYDWATSFDLSNDWQNNPAVNPGINTTVPPLTQVPAVAAPEGSGFGQMTYT